MGINSHVLEEQDNALIVMATIAKVRDTPLIASLSRKLDWENEQVRLGLTRRQFALLMLCIAVRVDDEAGLAAIAHYIGMNAEDLRSFLGRAFHSIQPPQEEHEEPVKQGRRHQNRSDL